MTVSLIPPKIQRPLSWPSMVMVVLALLVAIRIIFAK